MVPIDDDDDNDKNKQMKVSRRCWSCDDDDDDIDGVWKHNKYALSSVLSHFQVDYASEPMMLYKPQKAVIRRSFHYGIWLQHRMSAHQTQLHMRLHRLQVSVSATFFLCPLSLRSIVSLCEQFCAQQMENCHF